MVVLRSVSASRSKRKFQETCVKGVQLTTDCHQFRHMPSGLFGEI
jgi:hypothetical protein